MTVCQDDESNPHPSALENWSGITLRSPLSVVSDSFGHENEVDISKSSEENTSATGSKVAPRSMGSLFSPMEKAKQAQKEIYPFISRNYTGDKTICALHLGVRSIAGIILAQAV